MTAIAAIRAASPARAIVPPLVENSFCANSILGLLLLLREHGDAVAEHVGITALAVSYSPGRDELDPVAPELELGRAAAGKRLVLAASAVALDAVDACHVERGQGKDGNWGPIRTA